MTTEELLKPRWEVIADFPNTEFEVGDIVEPEYYIEKNVSFYSKYPHLFRKLEWWEGRKASEMPEYVKDTMDNIVYKVKKWVDSTPIKMVLAKNREWYVVPNVMCFFELPTEEEYDNSLTPTMKQKIVEYGTTHPVTVDSADKQMIVVIAHDIKEGFILIGHGITNLPKQGDKGKIVFEIGGPKKGYWQYYPNQHNL